MAESGAEMSRRKEKATDRRTSSSASQSAEEGNDTGVGTARVGRPTTTWPTEMGRGRERTEPTYGMGEAELGQWEKKAERELAARAKSRKGRRKIIKLLFYFLKHHFKSNLISNSILLQISIKPKHHKINMQQHVCTYMYVDLYLILI